MRFDPWLVRLLACSFTLGATPGLAARLLVANVDARGALPEGSWRSLQDTVAGAVSRAGHDVVTPQQLEALIGLEAVKQLAGCADESCVARLHGDLGGALGVDGIVTVTVSAAGSGVVVAVKRVGTSGGGRVADARVKDTAKQKKVDAVLDALPGLVAEVLTGLPSTVTTATVPTTVPTTAPMMTATTTTTAGSTPTSNAGTPWLPAGFAATKGPSARAKASLVVDPAVKKTLKVVEDGTGRLIVYNPADPFDGPLLAGTLAGGLFAQRVIGGGRDGDTRFDVTFWDARFSRGAERNFGFSEGTFSLVCGPTTTTYKPAPAATTKKALAALFDVAWQRHVVVSARDDDLTWYIVDDDLKDGDDFALHVGRKVDGRYRFSAVAGEIVRDTTFGDGVLLVAPGLKVKVGPAGGEVSRGAEKVPLTALDLFAQAPDIYGVMKPWGPDLALGTPCD